MQEPKRSARKPIQSTALISRGLDSWSSEILDISATGLCAARPPGWTGKVGDTFNVDILVGDSLDIHVLARVARIEGDEVGFAYSRIPDDKQIPLWNLLGSYADSDEGYSP
ncbi:PilZ domain-containing protein [Dokdonella sp.]|uniref:PilZ domain-containing protein n=1 Tax=Dokdonella sp. TaxID=2291710 RepID=UPI0025BE8CCC|nr:PilZ domain-containing protein [Dokdonella sp.]